MDSLLQATLPPGPVEDEVDTYEALAYEALSVPPHSHQQSFELPNGDAHAPHQPLFCLPQPCPLNTTKERVVTFHGQHNMNR